MDNNISLDLSRLQYEDLLIVLQESANEKSILLIHALKDQAASQLTDRPLDLSPKTEQSFEIGDKVRARWQGGESWYNGTIRAIKDNRYFIQYDDGDEEWTTANFIQPLFKPSSPENASSANFQVGDRVEARWQGGSTWYKGTIQDTEGMKYFVLYDDGDEEWTTTDLMVKI